MELFRGSFAANLQLLILSLVVQCMPVVWLDGIVDRLVILVSIRLHSFLLQSFQSKGDGRSS